jgi:hypothetical protein
MLPPSAGGVPLSGWTPPPGGQDPSATPASLPQGEQIGLFGSLWSFIKTILWFAFLYMAIGSAINYSVFHRSGLEAIPHSHLWLQGPSNLIDQIIYHGSLFARRSGLSKDTAPLRTPGGYQDIDDLSSFAPHKV